MRENGMNWPRKCWHISSRLHLVHYASEKRPTTAHLVRIVGLLVDPGEITRRIRPPPPFELLLTQAKRKVLQILQVQSNLIH